MEEPENIARFVKDYFSKEKDLQGKKVMITAGPTYEKIDPVRFIGNYSSGKMGFALADECASRGAKVILIAGPTQQKTRYTFVERYDVESASQMFEAVKEKYAGERINDKDGVKIDFADGWVHLRKSNTEPIIRVYSEAATMEEADALAKKVIDVVWEVVG